ncbi:MAG: glycosyltransferase family 9 protein [Candidatus Eisenbacteria bacterium]
MLAGAAGQALAEARPDVRITFLVKSEYADLVRGQPWVSDVWALAPGEERSPAGAARWRRRIAAAGFEAVVDLQTSPRSRALLAGHPRVLAWRAERWERRRWVWLRFTRPTAVRPEWLRFFDAVTPLGVDPAAARPPHLALPEAAVERARDWAAAWEEGPIVFLAPGARWATKRWPEESFLVLSRTLTAAGARVLVGGDASDRVALPALAAWASREPRAHWFEGSLIDLAAAVALAKGAVTNDTGLMHLAAAVGVPVVALFGSTHPVLGFAPAGARNRVLAAGLSCQPCTLHGRARCPLGHHRCMRDFSPETVLSTLRDLVPEVPGDRLSRLDH